MLNILKNNLFFVCLSKQLFKFFYMPFLTSLVKIIFNMLKRKVKFRSLGWQKKIKVYFLILFNEHKLKAFKTFGPNGDEEPFGYRVAHQLDTF